MRTVAAGVVAAVAALAGGGCSEQAPRSAAPAVAKPTVEVGAYLFRDGDRWSLCTGIGESAPPVCAPEMAELTGPPTGAEQVTLLGGDVAYSEELVSLCGVPEGDTLYGATYLGPWDDDDVHVVATFRADRRGPPPAQFPGGDFDLWVALRDVGIDVESASYDPEERAVVVQVPRADAGIEATVGELAARDPRLAGIPLVVTAWAAPTPC